ncbi:hypothetical protein OIU74_009408 [Salix koriyanagi]|uniref:Uncharacterized protein n=1 Tax=Salix koriyanagi TaxID=2511006 RepID=A0A9Q0TSP3_9ROSI|nr:hypothetical protein OIU74_009408 [Salix koriyanagi]
MPLPRRARTKLRRPRHLIFSYKVVNGASPLTSSPATGLLLENEGQPLKKVKLLESDNGNPELETGTGSIVDRSNVPEMYIAVASEIDEDLHSAEDAETSHWMIKALLFFNTSKQVLKGRVLQVGDRNNKSLLSFSNIHTKMAFLAHLW